MKPHLLFETRDFSFDTPLPQHCVDVIKDLELRSIFSAMAGGDKFLYEVASQVLLTSMREPEEIRYRQGVLTDCIAHPEIVREIYGIAVAALEDKRGLWGYSSRCPSSVLHGAVSQLEAHLLRLRELRKVADDHPDLFCSSGMRDFMHSLQQELDDDYFETISYHLRQLKFRSGVLISMELGKDNSGVGYILRTPERPKAGWKQRFGLEPRHTYSFSVPPRDEAGDRSLTDMTSRGINLVANAAAQSADHILSYFTMLRAELGFYLGCLGLHERLTAKGEGVSFPDPAPWRAQAFSCTNLRDASLALGDAGRSVMGNDVDADHKSLVIITGASSGGKSTFLRSVGQAQLMAQCGLFVVADALRTSVQEGVFTHFVREEDPSMTSGRLDEELSRMSAMADELHPRSMVLFNESFAATNEHEGSEIGRQVVRALLDADIRVCFVSHHFDFADSFYRQLGASSLFLRAPRDEDGHRSFKLEVAGPLPTSFGEDIYRRLGGWLPNEDLAPTGCDRG